MTHIISKSTVFLYALPISRYIEKYMSDNFYLTATVFLTFICVFSLSLIPMNTLWKCCFIKQDLGKKWYGDIASERGCIDFEKH